MEDMKMAGWRANPFGPGAVGNPHGVGGLGADVPSYNSRKYVKKDAEALAAWFRSKGYSSIAGKPDSIRDEAGPTGLDFFVFVIKIQEAEGRKLEEEFRKTKVL